MKKISMVILSAVGMVAFGAEADVQKQKTAVLELKKNLVMEMTARMEKDPVAAVEFCSQNAAKMTKDIEQKHGFNIKRVSEKNRNPQNIPNADEQKVLNEFKELAKQNKKVPEYVVVKNRYYEPIYTNQLCATCHGKDDEIAKATKEEIKKLYPNDKAVGYAAGDLRGLMVIW